MADNFDRFAVLVPGECEGMTWGYNLVTVLALDREDAIAKACAEWYGAGAREGTYLVGLANSLTAYEVKESRIPSIGAQVSLPYK